MKEIKTSQSINVDNKWKQNILPGYEDEIAAAENFNKFKELNEVFTNPTGRVTAVRPGSKDLTSAVLTARLSRAGERDVTELYWNEFREKTGENVGDRILNEFGDDSVREDASAHIFVRDVSVLTSMQVFKNPLLTGIEASTRYINWGELPLNDFAVIPEKLKSDPENKKIYEDAIKTVYNTYRELWPKVWDFLVSSNPREIGQSEFAYKKAIKGAVCDVLRALLPLGVKTNFGLHANFRTFSELVMDLRASEFSETSDVADEIAAELMKVNPVFIKVANSGHGDEWTKYKSSVDRIIKNFGEKKEAPGSDGSLSVEVNILNSSWSRDFLRAALIFANSERSNFSPNMLFAETLTYNSTVNLLKQLGEARANRRHKSPEVFNSIVVRDTIRNLSFGAFKDLNRHRFLLYKSQPDFSGSSGFVIPREISLMGSETEKIYTRAQNLIHVAMHKLQEKYPEESKLLLTHGTKTSFEMIMGAGEHFWISELRSGAGGNPEYREIAVELYKGLIEEATTLRKYGSFVDEKKYTLGRIGEAIRADLKGRKK